MKKKMDKANFIRVIMNVIEWTRDGMKTLDNDNDTFGDVFRTRDFVLSCMAVQYTGYKDAIDENDIQDLLDLDKYDNKQMNSRSLRERIKKMYDKLVSQKKQNQSNYLPRLLFWS